MTSEIRLKIQGKGDQYIVGQFLIHSQVKYILRVSIKIAVGYVN